MAKFFDDDEVEVIQDSAASQQHLDESPCRPKPIKDSKNGGVSNAAYLNDYRNRAPFHYIEEGADGYYFWQYGAQMEILFEIFGEPATTDPIPPYVAGVRVEGKSVVDPETMIANLGSMAGKSDAGYYTAEQVDAILSAALTIANDAKEIAASALSKVDRVETDLYSLGGPEYLMSRLVEGTNISIQRDVSTPEEPKLRISVVNSGGGGNGASLLITQGEGTAQDPFVVTTPAEGTDELLDPLMVLTLIFNHLPKDGLPYTPNQVFFARLTTVSGVHILEFTVSGAGFNNLENGTLKNGFYRLAGGRLIDPMNVNQIPYYGPTEGNRYEVEKNKPFMFMRGSNTNVIINGVTFSDVQVVDLSNSLQVPIPFVDLPSNYPLLAVYDTTKDPAVLTVSFSRLSSTYIDDDVIPELETKLRVKTSNLALTEEKVLNPDDWKD